MKLFRKNNETDILCDKVAKNLRLNYKTKTFIEIETFIEYDIFLAENDTC